MADASSIFKSPARLPRQAKYKKCAQILARRHSKFKRLIQMVGPLDYEIPIWPSINDAVLYAVIGQMLSISAVNSIIQRLLDRFDSSEKVIRWASRSLGRSGPVMGVSWRKRKALSEWGKYFYDNRERCLRWKEIPLEEYKKQVTSVWGFGCWSADMIAIFHLGRMDVWPETDTGIKRACRKLFGTDDYGRIKRYVDGCETMASVYLWESLNKKIMG